MPSISYCTRQYGNDSQRITGGSIQGSIGMETADRLVATFFTVAVKASGTPVFVDRSGREVSLYLHVDPADTLIGAAEIKRWRLDNVQREVAREALAKRQKDELDKAMAGMPHEEILRRLAK